MLTDSHTQAATPCDLTPPLGDAELVQLRVRIIALESLVVALLAETPPAQLNRALAMATHISPREGHTAHPMTLRAAEEIRRLVGRAERRVTS